MIVQAIPGDSGNKSINENLGDFSGPPHSTDKQRKWAKIRNRYNQVPHLTGSGVFWCSKFSVFLKDQCFKII